MNGGREFAVGKVLVETLRIRREYRTEVMRPEGLDDMIYAAAIVQCNGDRVDAGIEVRKVPIDELFPLEYLDKASTAFCGWFLLNGGEAVQGAMLKRWKARGGTR